MNPIGPRCDRDDGKRCFHGGHPESELCYSIWSSVIRDETPIPKVLLHPQRNPLSQRANLTSEASCGTTKFRVMTIAERQKGPGLANSIAWAVAYAGIAIAATWPLSQHLGSGYVASLAPMDTLHIAWALAHGTQAIVTDLSMLGGGNTFHPSENTFFLGPTALSGLPLFAPTYIWTRNPILALNILYLSSVTLTAFGIHAVVHRWTKSVAAGAIAGILFVTNPWMLNMASTIPHYSLLFFLPWIILLCTGELETRGRVLALTLLLAGQFVAEPVYIAPPLMLAVGLTTLVRLSLSEHRTTGLRLLTALVASCLLFLPVLLLHLRSAGGIGEWSQATTWQHEFPIVNILSSVLSPLAPRSISPALAIFFLIGIGTLLIPTTTDRIPKRARRAFWLTSFWFAIVFAVAQDRIIEIGGNEFRTPLAHLSDRIPSVARLRANYRSGVLCIVMGSMLAGLGFSFLRTTLRARLGPSRKYAQSALFGLSLAIVLLPRTETLLSPKKIASAPRPSALLAAQLYNLKGALAVLPAMSKATHRHMYSNAKAAYLSTFHWRPIINGYASYFPKGFRRRHSLMEQVPEPSAIAALVKEADMTAIWLLPSGDPDAQAKWQAMELDPASQFYLAGWDWQTGERLYLLKEDRLPPEYVVDRNPAVDPLRPESD